MSEDTLIALLGGREIGDLRSDRRGRLTFVYRKDWRSLSGAFPLSLSMPLASAEHRHDVVEAFMWGLLPDNENILIRWAKQFHVSHRNPFALLRHVGEDCAGAVQFADAERLDEFDQRHKPIVKWLNDGEIAERLRTLRKDHSAWRRPDDIGRFSLAGAQPKIALLNDDGRWGVPSGRLPTTHILKPPVGDLDGHAENEHICLSIARRLGIPAAASAVRRFEDQIAIVIERYDRARTASLAAAAAASAASKAAEATGEGDDTARTARAAAEAAAFAADAQAFAKLAETQPIIRIHQEDFCQALAIPPTSKYQNEGGPSPRDIVTVLHQYSSAPDEDIDTFVDALALNWLIAGTDAHAKNYSLLHSSGGRVRLAPLYDIASALPYDDMDINSIKMAMKIGGEYRLRDIGSREWRKLADEFGLNDRRVLDRLNDIAARTIACLPDIHQDAEADNLESQVVSRLLSRLDVRIKGLEAMLHRS